MSLDFLPPPVGGWPWPSPSPGRWAWICSLPLEASTPFAWEYSTSIACCCTWPGALLIEGQIFTPGLDFPAWPQICLVLDSGLTWWSGLSADPARSSCMVAVRAGVPGVLSCWPHGVCRIGTCWTHCEITSSAQAAPRAPSQFICTSPKLLPLLKWNILVGPSSGLQHHC